MAVALLISKTTLVHNNVSRISSCVGFGDVLADMTETRKLRVYPKGWSGAFEQLTRMTRITSLQG